MKKLLTILVLIMLIISFFQITSMYALYKEQIQGEYSTLLGAWEIKVNETDVTTSGQVETFTIANNQLGYVDSEYIQAGKIAPNGQAYFDIVIDPSNTDVSVIYTIDIDTKALSSTNTDIELVDAIEFISGENYFARQTEEGETEQATNDISYKDGNTYTSVIPIDKINEGYKNYIRLYFKWSNVTKTEIVDETEGTTVTTEPNNELDTALGETQIEVETEVDGETVTETKGATISIPIQINLKQYTGEVIGSGT